MAAVADGPVLDLAEKHPEVVDDKVNSRDEVSSEVDEVDDVHAGLEFPTEEERLTLRRVADALPWTAYCTPYKFLYISSH